MNITPLKTRLRILFYLPVTTPWWFIRVVAPLIRAASRGGEVHVLVPPLWSSTGIGSRQLALCQDIQDVHWHILDQPDHPELRRSALGKDYLLDLVRAIDPDISLCRSADIETPRLFPGVVRYIMEGGSPPFTPSQHSIQLTEGLFDHGQMPDLTPDQAVWLDREIASAWHDEKANLVSMGRDEFLERTRLPANKILIGMPLEYQHEEIFYDQHNLYRSNIEQIDAVAAQLGDDAMLVVTIHPTNEVHLTERALALKQAIRQRRDKVRMVRKMEDRGHATIVMTQHCDGMIVGNSKSFANCLFMGKPTLRLSNFASADWMRFYTALGPFVAALRAGTADVADEATVRRWFAFHLANNVLDPGNTGLSLDQIVDHVLHPVNPARWSAGIVRSLSEPAPFLPPPPEPQPLDAA